MTTTSREYAEALFELAVQANVTQETSEGVETVISALMQMIPALFSNAGIFAIWMQVIGSVLGMASTVIYNIYLFKAVKALNGMQDA